MRGTQFAHKIEYGTQFTSTQQVIYNIFETILRSYFVNQDLNNFLHADLNFDW